jgi:hypothetical protein
MVTCRRVGAEADERMAGILFFGALKSDLDSKRQFARNKVLVLYC